MISKIHFQSDKIRRVFALLLLSLLAIGFLGVKTAQAETVSQTFNSPTQLTEGSLVSLQQGSQSQIELANTDNINNLLGVVVASQSSLVHLDTNNGNTQVIVNGQASTLVSDINGQVNSGDPLTASPLSGVAMKASSQSKIVGLAQANFTNATQKQSQNVRDKTGKNVSITIGLIPVSIGVSQYVTPSALESNSLVVGVQAAAFSATGKTISPVRAVAALLVLLIAVGVSVVILYTSLSSSIRSIGRNPLSRHSILVGLIQVIIAVVVIMLSGFIIMYLIISR